MWGSHKADKILATLRCARPGQDPGAEKAAAKLLAVEPELRAQCALQRAFDLGVSSAVASAGLPGGYEERLFAPLPEAVVSKQGWVHFVKHPSMWAAFIAVAVLLGLAGYRVLSDLRGFPGEQVVFGVLADIAELDGTEFERFSGNAGLLGDWFFLNNNMDDFGPPGQLAEFPAVGCRALQVNGHPAGQFVVEEPRMVVTVLHAKDHGIDLQPQHGWHPLPSSGLWAGAVRQDEERVTLLAFAGEDEELREFLAGLSRPDEE